MIPLSRTHLSRVAAFRKTRCNWCEAPATTSGTLPKTHDWFSTSHANEVHPACDAHYAQHLAKHRGRPDSDGMEATMSVFPYAGVHVRKHGA